MKKLPVIVFVEKALYGLNDARYVVSSLIEKGEGKYSESIITVAIEEKEAVGMAQGFAEEYGAQFGMYEISLCDKGTTKDRDAIFTKKIKLSNGENFNVVYGNDAHWYKK